MANVLDLLVQRAHVEYAAFKQSKGSHEIMLKRIWNVMRKILENNSFDQNSQEGIDKLLTPLFAYLATDKKVPFEDDILCYITAILKKRKEVTPLIWSTFELFPALFPKYQGMLGNMFPALNQIIIYARENLNAHPELIKAIVEIAIQALNPTNT